MSHVVKWKDELVILTMLDAMIGVYCMRVDIGAGSGPIDVAGGIAEAVMVV